MKLRYTIVYVANVRATLAFYEQAFGLATRFVSEDGEFGELDTGATSLAFAQHSVARNSLQRDYRALDADALPAGIEIGFVVADVAAALARATAAGAKLLTPPTQKPWGQTVAYVQAPEGTLIELCTSMD